MPFIIDENKVGWQQVADIDTVRRHPLGMVIKATDPVLGGAEFIYLLGVASTVVGSPVTWNATTFQTTLAAVGANKSFPLAFAMGANVAASYGWYQISGLTVASKSATICLVAGVAVGVLTTGLVAGTGSGKEIQGAVVAATASAATGRITVTLHTQRPTLQGRVT